MAWCSCAWSSSVAPDRSREPSMNSVTRDSAASSISPLRASSPHIATTPAIATDAIARLSVCAARNSVRSSSSKTSFLRGCVDDTTIAGGGATASRTPKGPAHTADRATPSRPGPGAGMALPMAPVRSAGRARAAGAPRASRQPSLRPTIPPFVRWQTGRNPLAVRDPATGALSLLMLPRVRVPGAGRLLRSAPLFRAAPGSAFHIARRPGRDRRRRFPLPVAAGVWGARR